MLVGVLLLLLLAGCGVFAVTAVSGFIGRMSAPVDVANEYVDAARDGDDVTPYTCEPDSDVDPSLGDSRAQNLVGVDIVNRRHATVTGLLTLSDGFETEITVRLNQVDDAWCVHEVRF